MLLNLIRFDCALQSNPIIWLNAIKFWGIWCTHTNCRLARHGHSDKTKVGLEWVQQETNGIYETHLFCTLHTIWLSSIIFSKYISIISTSTVNSSVNNTKDCGKNRNNIKDHRLFNPWYDWLMSFQWKSRQILHQIVLHLERKCKNERKEESSPFHA